MRQRFTLSILVLMLAISATAQNPSPFNRGDKQLGFAGYLIRVIPLNGNGFGYDIFYKNQLVAHQLCNPFTLTPDGLKQEEDVYKIAKWQILQFREKRNNKVIKNQLISKDVAKQLNIKLNSLNN